MRLIAGKLNGYNFVRYWKVENETFNIGDYAIVENENDYDLVKITGVIETNEKYASLVANGLSTDKKVVSIIQRFLIRND